MKDDLISRMSLRESILASLILGGEKTLDQIIDEEPSVDAVKVVRCKDCIHKPKEHQHCCMFDMYVVDDFFCAEGERRKE